MPKTPALSISLPPYLFAFLVTLNTLQLRDGRCSICSCPDFRLWHGCSQQRAGLEASDGFLDVCVSRGARVITSGRLFAPDAKQGTTLAAPFLTRSFGKLQMPWHHRA